MHSANASNYAPVARRCNRRGLAKPDQGGKQKTNGGKLAFIRAVQAFTCHGGAAVPLSSFISLAFTSHAAFFGTFLVRPALLPYGKRGFRAAIYKIARPQPPAAALWLQESTVFFLVLLYILRQQRQRSGNRLAANLAAIARKAMLPRPHAIRPGIGDIHQPYVRAIRPGITGRGDSIIHRPSAPAPRRFPARPRRWRAG